MSLLLGLCCYPQTWSTPLLFAVGFLRTDIVALLLSHKANPNIHRKVKNLALPCVWVVVVVVATFVSARQSMQHFSFVPVLVHTPYPLALLTPLSASPPPHTHTLCRSLC